MKYTHNNGQLNINNVGNVVVLRGWVSKSRNLGSLIFIDLRDLKGITQLIVEDNSKYYNLAKEIRSEYVIAVRGIVRKRSSINSKMKTGEIEVVVKELIIISTAKTTPIIIADETDALEETRLRYRYLDLRRPVMQNFLIKRHEISKSIRNFLIKEGFLELETPILGKSTPEGARDFLVPSRLYHNKFFALPQSPQIYKQLFMVAGLEKYFQIVKCFRDEDLRADRQLEFTQVDIEASFVKREDIIKLIEKLFKTLFKEVLNIKLKTPFIQLKYKKALDLYGTDKPDNRYGLLLQDYKKVLKDFDIPFFKGASTIKGIVFDNANSITRKDIDCYTAVVKQNHGSGLAYLKNVNNELSGSIAKNITDVNKIGLKDNQILFLVAGKHDDVCHALGALRIELASQFSLYNDKEFSFLWVTDFPLLEWNPEEKRFQAMHHPFTSPKEVSVLKNNPKKAIADAYDIVINGYEAGGGSIRIHEQSTQQLMFQTLGFDEQAIKEKFGFFVEALQYGTPPHGGIALGLDRIVMLLTHTKNIKDVVAFPKTQSAKDLMSDAPSEVDSIQLDELGIKNE